MTAILVPLSTLQTITLYRQKYPEGLICTECGRLLATRRDSYRLSNLTEIQRLEHVCAECRVVARDPDQARQDRLDQLAAARAIAVENRSRRAGLAPTRIPSDSQTALIFAHTESSTSIPINLTGEPKSAHELLRWGRRGKPGRPRVAAPLKERARAYSRLYRQRQRLTRSEVPAHAL